MISVRARARALTRLGHDVVAEKELFGDYLGSDAHDLIILDAGAVNTKNKVLFGCADRTQKVCLTSVWNESTFMDELDYEYDYFLKKPFNLQAIKEILDSVKPATPVQYS